MNGWIIFLVAAVPIVLGLIWILADDSIVRIPSGAIGLLLVNGRATDTALDPGVHFVPRVRRHIVEIYPSTEASFRAGGEVDNELDRLDHAGPRVYIRLGDRTSGYAAYTLRLRLDLDRLKDVHVRFGPTGLWSAVRDLSSKVVREQLNQPDISVDDLYGDRRKALESRMFEGLKDDLAADGFIVSHFSLDLVDLGRAEDAIQSAVRARLEMAREEAEFDMRVERARRDAAIARELHGVDVEVAMRYRETDAWVDLASQMARNTGFLPDAPGRQKAAPPPEPMVESDDDRSMDDES